MFTGGEAHGADSGSLPLARTATLSAEPSANATLHQGIQAVTFVCDSTGRVLTLPTPPAPRLRDRAAPLARARSADAILGDQARASDRCLLEELRRLFCAPADAIEAEQRLIAQLWNPLHHV